MSQDIQKEVAAALQEMFAPKAAKKAKTPEFVVAVNGTIVRERPANKADLIKAAKAIIIRNPEAKIDVYSYAGPLSVDMPVTGAALESEEEGV